MEKQCDHSWYYAGSGTMLDPETGEERTYDLYVCSLCGTSEMRWS